jgi:hypothetical protein
MRLRFSLLIACSWLTAFWPVAALPSHTAPEGVVKAAVVFNLLAFVKWPDVPNHAGGRLLLCVLGDDATDQHLLQLDGKPVQDRRLAVERLAPSHEAHNHCDAVFIGSSNAPVLFRIAATTANSPVLLVGEGPLALENGAMIALSLSSDRYVFEINQFAVRKAGLTISSKLLRLARRVLN